MQLPIKEKDGFQHISQLLAKLDIKVIKKGEKGKDKPFNKKDLYR